MPRSSLGKRGQPCPRYLLVPDNLGILRGSVVSPRTSPEVLCRLSTLQEDSHGPASPLARFGAVSELVGSRRCGPGLWRGHVFATGGATGGTVGNHQSPDGSCLADAWRPGHGWTTRHGRHARWTGHPRDGDEHPDDGRRRAWWRQHPHAVGSHGGPWWRNDHPHSAECELRSPWRVVFSGSHGLGRRTDAHLTWGSPRWGGHPHACGRCPRRRSHTDASGSWWCSWRRLDPHAAGLRWCSRRGGYSDAADRFRWCSRWWRDADATRCCSRWGRARGPRRHSVGSRGRFRGPTESARGDSRRSGLGFRSRGRRRARRTRRTGW